MLNITDHQGNADQNHNEIKFPFFNIMMSIRHTCLFKKKGAVIRWDTKMAKLVIFGENKFPPTSENATL